MSFHIQHVPHDHIVYIKVTGRFTAKQYDQIMNQVVEDPKVSQNEHTLWDLTEMDFSNIHADFLHEIIEHRKKYDAKRGPKTKAAIVANSDLGFGVSRQYEAMSFEFSQKMQIFRTISEAKLWIQS